LKVKKKNSLRRRPMSEEMFGSVMYNGKMINVDKENIEVLKNISQELKEKNKKLEETADKIFNQ